MINKATIKRHGIDVFEGGVFSSTNVAADMQHYSDLLSASAQKIKAASIIADISDIDKLVSALNGAFQNARWISSDLEQYVRAAFAAEGISVTAVPFNKLAVSILSLIKILNSYEKVFIEKGMTLAAIKKQAKLLTTPIIETISDLSDDYDMYAGMVNSVIDKSQVNPDNLRELTAAVNKASSDLTEFQSGEMLAKRWRVEERNVKLINNIIYGLNSKIGVYADPSSKKYIKSPAVVSAIEGFDIACTRLRSSDTKKYWSLLDSVAIALGRLKDVL